VLNNAVRYAIDHHLGNVISLSWGAPEGAINGAGNNTQLMQAHENFLAAQAAGISVFAAAGDNGASNYGLYNLHGAAPTANAQYPASDPLVTAVGGTNLFMSDAGVYQSEDVWNDSDAALCPFGCTSGVFGATGGSPSLVFAVPSFQQVSGSSKRSTSDVSYNASVYTAVMVYLGFLGGNNNGYFFGGTSEGAPQWAAITALANQANGQALGYLNPSLYAAATVGAFHDITVGENGFLGTPGFSASAGYDFPTGVGSPDVAKVIHALTGK
jgi:subtilase family serine protease